MKINSHIKVGELEVPIDYFKLNKLEKDILCNEVMDAMLHILDRQLNPELDRLQILDKLLESSIITNEKDETYEVAAVLRDIRNIINE